MVSGRPQALSTERQRSTGRPDGLLRTREPPPTPGTGHPHRTPRAIRGSPILAWPATRDTGQDSAHQPILDTGQGSGRPLTLDTGRDSGRPPILDTGRDSDPPRLILGLPLNR
jgi:hypothetical protein